MNDAMSPECREDLTWWWTRARTLRWTWATTFAHSAPHWYIVPGRTGGMTRDDFVRVNRLIRRFGTPGKYFSYANLYLLSPEGTHKVWCMFPDDPDSDEPYLVNLARTDRTYGPQVFTQADNARLAGLRLPPVSGSESAI